MKNEFLLEYYYLPGRLESAIGRFVEYYDDARHHESLNNLTPADVHYDRSTNILHMRRKTKQRTMNERRRRHRQNMVA